MFDVEETFGRLELYLDHLDMDLSEYLCQVITTETDASVSKKIDPTKKRYYNDFSMDEIVDWAEMEGVEARTSIIDKGKKKVSQDETEGVEARTSNVDSDYDSEFDSDDDSEYDSDKSVDYLSPGEEQLIEIKNRMKANREAKAKAKGNSVSKMNEPNDENNMPVDNVRGETFEEYDIYMNELLTRLKTTDEDGITQDRFILAENTWTSIQCMMKPHNEDRGSQRLMKSMSFGKKVVAKCGQRPPRFSVPEKGKQRKQSRVPKSYVPTWFETDLYFVAYHHFLKPVPSMNFWPDQSMYSIVLPPKPKKMPDRPRKKRIRFKGEGGSLTKVSKIGVPGRPRKKQSVINLEDADVNVRGAVKDGSEQGVAGGSKGGPSTCGSKKDGAVGSKQSSVGAGGLKGCACAFGSKRKVVSSVRTQKKTSAMSYAPSCGRYHIFQGKTLGTSNRSIGVTSCLRLFACLDGNEVRISRLKTRGSGFFSHLKCKGTWSNIAFSINLLHSNGGIPHHTLARKVNDGKSTTFWHDFWNNGWVWNWTRSISKWIILYQFKELLHLLESVHLSDNLDAWHWDLANSNIFTVKETGLYIDDDLLPNHLPETHWCRFIPKKVNNLSWRALRDSILNRWNLNGKGFDIPLFLCL
nr:RNA-directed DNA polymerase, eukaryota [Tanacetum cinerariifolium]